MSFQNKITVRSGAWMVLAAATLWGTTGTSQALAPEGATPPVIGALRLAVGGFFLLLFALGQGSLRRGQKWPVWTTLLAAVCMAAYQVFFFGGVARTGVAVGTIVGIGSSPILGGVLGLFFRGERPGRAWGLATAMAIVGAALLAGSGGDLRVDLLGLFLAISAGAAYAAFTLLSKNLFDSLPSEAVMAVVFVLAAAMLLPVLLTANLSWVASLRGAGVILHLGLITVGLAYSLFGRGLRSVPVSTAVTLTLAEPMTAGLLGLVFLREAITPLAGLGIVLIFGGLAVLVLGDKKQPQRAGKGNL